MNRVGAGFGFALLVCAGCADEPPGASPTLPPPPAPLPEPLPRPEPVQDPDGIPIGFGGVLPAPGAVLTLFPGTEYVIPVIVEDELPRGLRDFIRDGVDVEVVSDAPPGVLSVPGRVTARDWREPGIVRIRALDSPGLGASDETYTIRLRPPFLGFPERSGLSFRVDAEPVRVRIADGVSFTGMDCGGFSLTSGAVRSGAGGAVGKNWFGDLGSQYRSADLTLRSPAGPAELRLVSDYQELQHGDFGATYNLVPVMFALGLDLEGTVAGFEQTLSLAWFDELRLRATLPGCAPLDLHCANRGGCRTR